MPPPLPRGAPPADRSQPSIVVDERTLPIVVVRHRRARRYLLRVTDEGGVRLTMPARASAREGIRFAQAQAGWIACEWRRLRDRAAWVDGTVVWYRGIRETVRVLDDGVHVAELHVPAEHAESEPSRAIDVRTLVHTGMRRVATVELVRRGRALAAAGGYEPTGVVVRAQRTRWGSCSSRGVVSLNWRLIQMPSAVADYVIHHELVHLTHPNHSPAFWRSVEAVCRDWRAGEAWLRRFGRELL